MVAGGYIELANDTCQNSSSQCRPPILAGHAISTTGLLLIAILNGHLLMECRALEEGVPASDGKVHGQADAEAGGEHRAHWCAFQHDILMVHVLGLTCRAAHGCT